MTTITNVRTTLTAPDGIALVVVHVETDEPGLSGLGCATFTQRPTLVAHAVEDYLEPLLIGRDPANIEDLWHMMYVNAYWRNGPVLNNAISGVDMALWDIKGKVASMPVYELLGGKCREAAVVYRHAEGSSREAVLDRVLGYRDAGYLAVRCQLGGYGGRDATQTDRAAALAPIQQRAAHSFPGTYYDPVRYASSVVAMFDHVRSHVGDELWLLHDIHERLAPNDSVRLAVDLEPYRLFFLEDPFPPDQVDWFHRLRRQTTTPIAMGELHNHPLEWKTLVSAQLIDFVRSHISQLGGITPARKLAAVCETFGVRTAWHGPGDVSPVGHAANLHLDLATRSFGIQEVTGLSDVLNEVFPGTPTLRDGHLWASTQPGLGIEIDETLAAKFPVEPETVRWTQSRWPDGTSWTP